MSPNADFVISDEDIKDKLREGNTHFVNELLKIASETITYGHNVIINQPCTNADPIHICTISSQSQLNSYKETLNELQKKFGRELLMQHACTLGFKIREKVHICFGTSIPPDQQIADEVKIGNLVTLKKKIDDKDLDVSVRVTKDEGAGFIGIIYGPEHQVKEIGLQISDEISFFKYHVFECNL